MLTAKQKEIVQRYLGPNFNEIDALGIYPFRYDHFEIKPPSAYEIDDDVLISGQITSTIQILRFGRRTIVKFRLSTSSEDFQVTVYNQPYFKRQLEGQVVSVLGKLTAHNQIVANKVNQQPLEKMEGFFPIYPLKGDVKQFQMRAIMKKLLRKYQEQLGDQIPIELIDRYRLSSRRQAIKQIHFPSDQRHLNQALRTLKYEELLRYQVALQLQRQEVQDVSKPSRNLEPASLKQYRQSLPFELNEPQNQVLEEIIDDLNGPTLMRRLLQGDVGSGKTVVALLSALLMMEQGFQICLLVPTEVLYHQHLQWFMDYFGSQFKIAGYTSSLPTAEKRLFLEELATGEIQGVVATHAIFSPDVEFSNLGYVIMDEQHRFGVQQRQALLDKGEEVDVLMMSATPIPRTLAASVYAHLSISTLTQTIASRQHIQTKLILENSIRTILDHLLERIETYHEQVYLVLPAITEGALPTRNVSSVAKNLQQSLGQRIRIAQIHGQLPSEIIQERLAQFRNHEIDLLVSTTIIEVGIDVSRANTMVIYDADRFGLAQLHQLRGRIGRQSGAGWCYLLTNSQNEDALHRLRFLEKEDDGFKIAQYDLKSRGSGDLLGERQSGFPAFSIANIFDDEKILVQAQLDAQELCYNNHYEPFVASIRKDIDSILTKASI